MAVARELVAERDTSPSGALTLRHWRAGWWEWRATHWVEIERGAVRAAAYAFTEHAVYQTGEGTKPWSPTRSKIADLVDPLVAVVHLPENIGNPSWLEGRRTGMIVSYANGLLDVQTRELLDHTPEFLNGVSVPFEYYPDTLDPTRWLGFLEELWPDDETAPRALAEWLGYILSGRTGSRRFSLLSTDPR